MGEADALFVPQKEGDLELLLKAAYGAGHCGLSQAKLPRGRRYGLILGNIVKSAVIFKIGADMGSIHRFFLSLTFI